MESGICSSGPGFGMESHSPTVAQYLPPPEQQSLNGSHTSNSAMVKSNAYYWEVVCEAFSEVGATPDKTLYLRLKYSNSKPHVFECCCMGNLSRKYSALKDLSNHILNNHCSKTKMCLLCMSDESGCNVTFTDAMDISHHATHQHHLSLLMYYMCDECQLVLPGVQALKYHLIFNHNEEFDHELVSKFRCFPCFLCLMPFKSQSLRKNHFEKKHGVFVEMDVDNLRKKSENQISTNLEEIQQCLQITRNFIHSSKLAQDILSQCSEVLATSSQGPGNDLTEKLKDQGIPTRRFVDTNKDIPIMWPISEKSASASNQNLGSSMIGNCQVSEVPESFQESSVEAIKSIASDTGSQELENNLQNQVEANSSSDTSKGPDLKLDGSSLTVDSQPDPGNIVAENMIRDSTQSSTCLPLNFYPMDNEKKTDNSQIEVDSQPESPMEVDVQPDDSNKEEEENRIQDALLNTRNSDSLQHISSSIEFEEKMDNNQESINLQPESPIELDLRPINNITMHNLVYHVEDSIFQDAIIENHHQLSSPCQTNGRPIKKKSKKSLSKNLPRTLNPPFDISSHNVSLLDQVQSSKTVSDSSFRAKTPEADFIDKNSSGELHIHSNNSKSMENIINVSCEKIISNDVGITHTSQDLDSAHFLPGTDGAYEVQEWNEDGFQTLGTGDNPDFSNNQVREDGDLVPDRLNGTDNTRQMSVGHYDMMKTNRDTPSFKKLKLDDMFSKYPLVCLFDIFQKFK